MKIDFEICEAGSRTIRRLNITQDGRVLFGLDMLDEEIPPGPMAQSLRQLADKVEKVKNA